MVHFVGAGPGAVDLITVRGMEILKKADVIIYAGSLVNQELLQYAKDGCRIFNSATMTLEEVVDVIQKAEEQGLMTARVHTGDPSVYGAIKEQMDELEKRQISYDVCPGVSSLFGAAAALNVELTLPNVSQTVIITRKEGRTPVPAKENLVSLSRHGATMALFLSASMVSDVTKDLLEGGYEPETPVAVVYKATWPDEKILHTTLRNLEEDMKNNNIVKTALILVGHVLNATYDRSKLYDPAFTTEFRKGTNE